MTARAPLLLAIDQGTQSTRALLFDSHGELVAARKIAIPPYFSTEPAWAEQHAGFYWDTIARACLELWDEPGAGPDARARLAAVALACQRGTTVCLDEAGEPLRPARVWLDQRRARRPPPLPAWLRAGVALVGAREVTRNLLELAECNRLVEEDPDLWRRTARYGVLSAYLCMKLAGRWVDSTASQVSYLPFDYRKLDWARPGHFLWQALVVRRAQLPDLVPPGSPIGAITDEAAAATGIPAGTPLVSAGADKASEVLGAGALSPEVACLSFGTTATINVCSPRYVEPVPFLPAYPAAVPGQWNLEQMVQRGYLMVDWWKREFGHPEVAEAAARGVAPESLFERLLDETPPGAMGLLMLPYWTPPLGMAGPESKGAFIGFGDVHGRAHVYRAIIEGITHALQAGRRRIQRRTGVPITAVRAVGGGTRSPGALQITADLFNLPVETPHVWEAGGLGAAINAAVGVGLYLDHASAVAGMVRTGSRVEPRPEAARLYEALHRRAYAPLYGRLVGIYRAIRAITNYPR